MLESGDIVAHWRCLVGSPGRPREGGRQEHHDAAKTRKQTIWLQISSVGSPYNQTFIIKTAATFARQKDHDMCTFMKPGSDYLFSQSIHHSLRLR